MTGCPRSRSGLHRRVRPPAQPSSSACSTGTALAPDRPARPGPANLSTDRSDSAGPRPRGPGRPARSRSSPPRVRAAKRPVPSSSHGRRDTSPARTRPSMRRVKPLRDSRSRPASSDMRNAWPGASERWTSTSYSPSVSPAPLPAVRDRGAPAAGSRRTTSRRHTCCSPWLNHRTGSATTTREPTATFATIGCGRNHTGAAVVRDPVSPSRMVPDQVL